MGLYAMDFLQSEKNKVKGELKKFDNDFFESFQRYPNRNEKEIMRVLYMYYKNLKQAIDNKQSQSGNNNENKIENKVLKNNFTQNLKNNHSSNPTPSIHSNNHSFIETFENNSNIKEKEKKIQNNLYSNLILQNNKLSNNNSIKDSILSQPEKTSIISSKNSYSSYQNNFLKKTNDILIENEINFDESNTKINHPLKEKKLTKSDIINLEKEFEMIKRDQTELKQKLHNYQKDFYEVHNRRVKYYKDIIGVEYEYQKYKENKNKMKEIQDLISEYKKNRKKD